MNKEKKVKINKTLFNLKGRIFNDDTYFTDGWIAIIKEYFIGFPDIGIKDIGETSKLLNEWRKAKIPHLLKCFPITAKYEKDIVNNREYIEIEDNLWIQKKYYDFFFGVKYGYIKRKDYIIIINKHRIVAFIMRVVL